MPRGAKRDFLPFCMPMFSGTSCAQIFAPPSSTSAARSAKSSTSTGTVGIRLALSRSRLRLVTTDLLGRRSTSCFDDGGCRLGYTRYVAQGGDWGALVTEQMGVQAPAGLLGIHTNMPSAIPAEVAKALQSGSPPPGLSADESAAFERLGGLDVLVNSAWGGYERMVEDGKFTWPLPFWEQPMHRWSSMLDAGVRAAFVASSLAAKLMIPRRRGLIVNISYWAARKPLGNVIYGVSKAATDKMTADMAY